MATGTQWYSPIPTSTHRYPLVPTGTQYLPVPISTRWDPPIPTDTHWYLSVPTGTFRYPKYQLLIFIWENSEIILFLNIDENQANMRIFCWKSGETKWLSDSHFVLNGIFKNNAITFAYFPKTRWLLDLHWNNFCIFAENPMNPGFWTLIPNSDQTQTKLR